MKFVVVVTSIQNTLKAFRYLKYRVIRFGSVHGNLVNCKKLKEG